MTIYNINFGIGWASSGVEYAQAYRATLLRGLNVPMKFVFLDFISAENIQTLTSHIGFQDDEVIWLYQYFTDIPIAPTTYTIDDLKQTVAEPIQREEQSGKVRRLFLQDDRTFITCYLKDEDQDVVDRAEFVIDGQLIRKDYYSYVRTFSEYYAPIDNQAKLFMRQYYNEDGTIAYNEYIDGETHVYAFDDMKLYSKEAFVAYFMQQLHLTSEDIVIFDRASKVGQAMLQNTGDSKVGVVVHAEHYSKHATDDETVLWNNYYEYEFSHAKDIDFFITATDKQNQTLLAQFQKYAGIRPRIFTIPVGSVPELKYPKPKRRAYSMVTASRLASEKHVDWLVRAAILAKQRVPKLSFDIYGEGGEKEKIRQIIEENDASSYIHLRGHVKLDEIYKHYKLFVSASTSEGFGLTLMEAVGSGLGMIGFDVDYGNPTFIQHRGNGYLIPIDQQRDRHDEIIERYAEHIIQFFNKGPRRPHHTSYKIAKPYLTQHIQNKWKKLIEEVQHG
ncbi:accessory Sec system glycosyltransferase GtfA [Staphylococcus canis]|uniref:UDP-N-acetylglucosamine--peptide N-acetylglucosaminyltransferase GtfA subunit n=1 Tax=Staphylococcus canis TaxID=2724942 RepID=A0ABS0TA92_9STAP|nr:accessory Sec system glycosyltransferase GtfA [Staphylococcus canis]MBI5975597.1 accessory Sec system glycosyltransferase GtfA [Staphylococcus canis]